MMNSTVPAFMQRVSPSVAATPSYQLIAMTQLSVGQYQPRQHFDHTALAELAQSIRKRGVLEPLLVRELTCDQYEIVAGERRYRAALLAQLTAVPCLVGPYNDLDAATIAIIENIQREDLQAIEEAHAYQRLLREFHFTQAQIARMVGKSRSHIANILRLLSLCDGVQTLLQNAQLSCGHAKILVGLTPELQHMFAQQAAQHNWSVRTLEAKIRQKKQVTKSQPMLASSPAVSHLQTALAEQVGAPVEIICDTATGGGWLKIKYFDNETLLGLLERMGLRYD